jgi:hypothetical protein
MNKAYLFLYVTISEVKLCNGKIKTPQCIHTGNMEK